MALGFVYFPALQGLQVQSDGSDGCFELVSDCVDKTIVLFVATNSRTRKIVLRMIPVMIAPKKMIPRKTLMPSRQLRMIQPPPTATARAASTTPKVRKNAMARRRLAMRMQRILPLRERVQLQKKRDAGRCVSRGMLELLLNRGEFRIGRQLVFFHIEVAQLREFYAVNVFRQPEGFRTQMPYQLISTSYQRKP